VVAGRVAVVVKIDNIDAARPQVGVNQADVVYEEMVEGGLTRLAAVFQSNVVNRVGPVRSGRTTDIAIVDDLHHPVFAYAGTNAMFLYLIREQPILDVDPDNYPSQFARDPTRAAPHNDFVNVSSLLGLTRHRGSPPPALWPFRPAGSPLTGKGVTPAKHITVNFPTASATWDWNAKAGAWLRGQNGSADVDSAGHQVSAANVIIQFVNYYTAGYATGEGLYRPAPIPGGQLTGTGQAWVLSGNSVVKGKWSRTSLGAVTSFVDASGAPIGLAAGRTWVELVPVGSIPVLLP
jgi:hypothetical protein